MALQNVFAQDQSPGGFGGFTTVFMVSRPFVYGVNFVDNQKAFLGQEYALDSGQFVYFDVGL